MKTCPKCGRDVDGWTRCVCGWMGYKEHFVDPPKRRWIESLRFNGESLRAYYIRMTVILVCFVVPIGIFFHLARHASEVEKQNVRLTERLSSEKARCFEEVTTVKNKGDEEWRECARSSIDTNRKLDQCVDYAASSSAKAEFWYKWQHAKNGPHCARALRLVESYEKDAKHCEGLANGAQEDVPALSLKWWCEERQKTIEADINKVEVSDE